MLGNYFQKVFVSYIVFSFFKLVFQTGFLNFGYMVHYLLLQQLFKFFCFNAEDGSMS